jgi:hypothetical protein
MRGYLTIVRLSIAASAGCTAKLPVTPLNDLVHLEITPTRDGFAAGDSGYVRILNRDAGPYVWHRCAGVRLDRRTSSGWAEEAAGPCTPGYATVPSGQPITIAFFVPAPAPAGQYRVRLQFSYFDPGEPAFWWQSSDFEVTRP